MARIDSQCEHDSNDRVQVSCLGSEGPGTRSAPEAVHQRKSADQGLGSAARRREFIREIGEIAVQSA